MVGKSYSQLMGETNSYISIKLDLREPVEISDFAALFAGVGGQFDAYLKEEFPDLKGKAQMYVKEVRKGSIIAELFADIPDLIGYMDNVLVVLGFGALFSMRVRQLVAGKPIEDANKTDLQEIGKTIRAVSNDAGGTMVVESVKYEKGVWHTNVELKLTTVEARAAEKTIDEQKRALDVVANVDHERVLMVFERSRKSDTKLDKTGELVVIEDLTDKPKALIYGSEMIEQEIKHEIREADDNIYKKGFIVDVNVRQKSGRAIGYVVTKVHQVIDLPDED